MKSNLILAIAAISLLAGCGTVPNDPAIAAAWEKRDKAACLRNPDCTWVSDSRAAQSQVDSAVRSIAARSLPGRYND